MNFKNRYIELCHSDIYTPVYMQPWWLDIVCGPENWNVCLSLAPDGQYWGSWVYYREKKRGLKQIKMPPMTTYSGLWINYPENLKLHSRYAFDKKVITDLIAQLPSHDLFYQQLHPAILNGLPLQWLGFRQSMVYTYILDLKNSKRLEDNLKGSVRTDLKKATAHLQIIEESRIEPFFNLIKKRFIQKGQPLPYKLDIFHKLDIQLKERKQRKIFLAVDNKHNIHAGVYLIFDRNRAYYYSGARDVITDQYNGLTLALWHAIQYSAEIVKSFDFEGSVLPDIEFFFRAFGGQLTPHFKLTKTKSKWLHALSLFLNKEYH